jgi:hypothetical protein
MSVHSVETGTTMTYTDDGNDSVLTDFENDYEESIHSINSGETTKSQDRFRFKFAKVVNSWIARTNYFGNSVTPCFRLSQLDDKMRPFLRERESSYPHYLEYKKAEHYFVQTVYVDIRQYCHYRVNEKEMKYLLDNFPRCKLQPMPWRDFKKYPYTEWDFIDKLSRWKNYNEEMFNEDSRNAWYMSYREGPRHFSLREQTDFEFLAEICEEDGVSPPIDIPFDPKHDMRIPEKEDIITSPVSQGLYVETTSRLESFQDIVDGEMRYPREIRDDLATEWYATEPVFGDDDQVMDDAITYTSANWPYGDL